MVLSPNMMNCNSFHLHICVAGVPGAAAGPGPGAYFWPLVFAGSLMFNALLMPFCIGTVVAGAPPSKAGSTNNTPVRNKDAMATNDRIESAFSRALRGALGG
jgi:hypothetical protein